MVKGIVRRLDDLGRVVIPKEYRKMYNIELGDPMEIYALDNGDIVVRKVNLSSQLEAVSEVPLNSLAQSSGKVLLLSGVNSFIRSYGSGKVKMNRRELPDVIADLLNSGKSMNTTSANDAEGIVLDGLGYDYFAMVPITCQEELRGGIFMLGSEPISEGEMLAMKTVENIISNSLQKI